MRLRVGIQQHNPQDHQNSSSSSSPSSNHFQLDPLDEDNSIFRSFFCSSSSSSSSSSNHAGLMKFPFSSISENHLHRHSQFLSRPLFSLTSLSSPDVVKRPEVFFDILSPFFAENQSNKTVFHLKEENRIMAEDRPNAPLKSTSSEYIDDDNLGASLDNKNAALLRPLHVSSCFDDTINGHNNIVDFLHRRLTLERQVKEHHEKSTNQNLFHDVLKNQEETTANSCAPSSSISMFFKILDFERRTLNMNNIPETVDVYQIEGKSSLRESIIKKVFSDDEAFMNCTFVDPVSPVMLKPIHHPLKINNDSIQHPFFINNKQSSSSLSLGKELSRTSKNLHLPDFLLRRADEPHIFDKTPEKHDGLSTKLFFSSSSNNLSNRFETKSLVFCEEEEANRHDEFVDRDTKMTFKNTFKNVVNKDQEELLDDIMINNNENSSSLKLLHLVPFSFDHLFSASTISKTLNKQQHDFYSSLSKQNESTMMKLRTEDNSIKSSKDFFSDYCETRPFDVLARTRSFFCEHFDTNVSYSSSSGEGNCLMTLRCFPHFSRIIHTKMSLVLFNHQTSPLATALDEEASDERMKRHQLFKLLKEVVQHSSNDSKINNSNLTINSNFFDELNRKYSLNSNTTSFDVLPHHADFTALSSSSMKKYIFQEDNSTSFLSRKEFSVNTNNKKRNTLVHHFNFEEEEEFIESIINPTLSDHRSSSAKFIINPSHISREDLQLCSAKPWSRLFKNCVSDDSISTNSCTSSIFPFDSYYIHSSLFSSLSTTIKIHALRFVKEHLVVTVKKTKMNNDNTDEKILHLQKSSSSSSSFILNIIDIFASCNQQKQTDIFRVAALWSVLVSLILSRRDHFFGEGAAVEENNHDEIEDESDYELDDDDDDDDDSETTLQNNYSRKKSNNKNNEVWIAGSNFETCFALIGAVALFSKNTGSSFGISPSSSSSSSSEVSVKVLLQEELMHFNGDAERTEERKSPAIIVLLHDDDSKNHDDDEDNHHHNHLRMIHSCLRGKWGNSVKIVSMVFPVSSLSSSSSSSLSNNSKCLKQLDPIFMVHHQNLEKQRCISDRFLLSENPLNITMSSSFSSSSSSFQTVRIHDHHQSSSTKTTKFAEIQNVLSAELSSLKNNNDNSTATIANFVCSSVVPFIFDHLETLIVMPTFDTIETKMKHKKQKVFIILDISNTNNSSSINQEWILPLRNALQKNSRLQERFSVSVKSKSSCLAEFEKHATTKILSSSSSSNTSTSNNNSSYTPTTIFLFETDDVSDSTSSPFSFEDNFKDIVTILISDDLTKENDEEDDETNYSKKQKQNAKNSNNVGCFGSALSSFLLVHPSSKNIQVQFSSKLLSVDKEESPVLSSDDEDY